MCKKVPNGMKVTETTTGVGQVTQGIVTPPVKVIILLYLLQGIKSY